MKRIAWLGLTSAVLCGSCSPKPPSLHPVHGKIFFERKPAHGAVIVLHPANDPSPAAPRPSGLVGTDGSFTLGTFEPGDGAPAGDYLAAIAWFEDRAKRNPVTGEVPNKLPNRYSDPWTAKLPITIKEGPNKLQPFHLTR